MFFAASDELLQQGRSVSVGGLVSYYAPTEQCDLQGRDNYDDGTYTGTIATYENCNGMDTSVVILAAAPEDESHVVLIYMQLVGESDDDAVKSLVLGSFNVVEDEL